MPRVRTDCTYTGSWLSSRLGLEPRKLDLRRRSWELLAVPADADASEWLYPAWQFDRALQPLPAVSRVLGAARETGLSAQQLEAILRRRDGLTGSDRLVDSLLDGQDEHVLAVIRSSR